MDGRFDEIAAFADIGEFIDQPVRTYSSGMYVRLAFAAAIHADPDILVVDEALAVGDAAFQAKCFGRLSGLREANVTVLFVSHDLTTVTSLCDRAILLESAGLRAIGGPKAVIDAYRASHPRSGSTTANSQDTPTKWVDFLSLNPAEVRYGDGLAEIIDCGLFSDDGQAVQLIQHGASCRIELRVQVRAALRDTSVAFVIKDTRGGVLCGSSTSMESIAVPPVEAGATLHVVFSFAVLLNPGHYLLSVGCHSFGPGGELQHHDVRTDVLPFEILGRPRHGVFCPPIDIHLA